MNRKGVRKKENKKINVTVSAINENEKEDIIKNGNRHGKFDPSLKSKITSTANLSQAYTQERGILMIPEEIKHTKIIEINKNIF